ncbi:MAG: transposase [Clostridiales bacterium]|nr:transposase [Clostridiales bacterium]
MKLFSTCSVKIKHYNHIFKKTVELYQAAVDFYIVVCLKEWKNIVEIQGSNAQQMFLEQLTHRTKNRPEVKYDFSRDFYKFPSYLRRSAISEAIGKVSSYKSNLANWTANPIGKPPSITKAGNVYPAMFRDNMYVRIDDYTAKIKVFIRNTWDWLTISLKKSDVDYILRKCSFRKECVPTLQKRGKEWFLDFPFEEQVTLSQPPVEKRIAIAVDLGLHNACVCSAMMADGTILGRHFLSLPKEKDCLAHAINRIKKAQQHGATKMPRLWAKAKGINHAITSKTAQFIIDIVCFYHADVIVFEHLELKGKKHGSKKQKLHHWKCLDVQSIVANKAHRLGVRISRICARGTSSFAYDGSGKVIRDKNNYSMCTFANGKRYHCDLSATYNIGARYFIRERLKSLPETVRLGVEAKVPPCTKRSTCTLSTLIRLNAVLAV